MDTGFSKTISGCQEVLPRPNVLEENFVLPIQDRAKSNKKQMKYNKQNTEPNVDSKKPKVAVTKPKNYFCIECGKAYGNALFLERHMKKVCKVGILVGKVGKESEGSHSCIWCEAEFKTKLELKQHEKIGCIPWPSPPKAPRTKERFSKLCEYCGIEFKGNAVFSKHLLKHRNGRRHKCSVCGKGFNRAEGLKSHVNYVHGKRPWLNCSRCDFRTVSKNHMVAHEKIHDLPEGAEMPLSFLCHCGKGFISRYKLSMHNNYYHKPKKCNMCGETLGNSKMLTQHKLHAHDFRYTNRGDPAKAETGPKTGQSCPICGKTFTTATPFGYHLEVEHDIGNIGPDRLHCKKCGKTYKSLASYVFHSGSVHKEEVNESELRTAGARLPLTVKTGVEFECDRCGKKYGTRLRLQAHVFRHHDTPASGLSCEACDVSFQTRAELYNHKHSAVHAPAEKITCKICHKRFKDGSTLWAHKIVHTSAKMSCPECGSKFKRKGDYSRHMRVKHEGSKESS